MRSKILLWIVGVLLFGSLLSVPITTEAQGPSLNQSTYPYKSLSVYISNDAGSGQAVLAGVGPAPAKGYYSFLGARQFSNGREFFHIRLGSDHNSSADGDMFVYRYSSGTLSAATTIRLDDVGYNITNGSVGVGNNDRAFVFYSRQKSSTGTAQAGLGTSSSDQYYKYSDDYYSVSDPTTATWSSEQRMTLDFGELYTTSTTSINLNTVTVSSTLNLTIPTGLNIIIGRLANVASRSDFTNRFVKGTVTSYNSGTGDISLTVTAKAGTTTHTDWDFAQGSYIDCPGDMIRLSNGDLLRSVWTTTGGTSSVMIYKSTAASNGLAWTYLSTITSDAVNPNDETGIVQLLDGRILAIIRCNTLAVYRQSFSSDNGATWSALTSTGIGGVGKVALDISPQGKVCAIARGTDDSRTIMFHNTDYTYTRWAVVNTDERGPYMYGGLFWKPETERFVSYYAAEAGIATPFQGPTVVIRKEFVQSQSPVTPPPLYDRVYRAWLDYGQAAGETLPDVASRTIDNVCIDGLRRDGALLLHDHLYFFEYNSTSPKEISKRSIMKPWQKATETASPTYATTGWTWNGSTQYLDLGWAPNTMANYTQDNGAFYYYTPSNVTSDTQFDLGTGIGSFSTVSSGSIINPKNTSNFAAFCVNDNTNDNSNATVSTSAGHWMAQRIRGSVKRIWQNNSIVGSWISDTSSGRSSRTFLLGAVNYNSSVNRFSTRTIGYFGIGGSFSGFEVSIYNRLSARHTALGL